MEEDGRKSKQAKGRWMEAKQRIMAEKAVVEAIMEEREKKRKSKRMKKACVKMIKFFLSTTGLLIINGVVMVLGGYIFNQLESENELMDCKNSRSDYYNAENATLILLMDMAQQMDGSGALSETEKQDLLDQFTTHMRAFALSVISSGYDYTVVCEDMGTENGTDYAWSLTGSIVFAVTVVTTIGYGQIAPATMWGRLVCIAYALIGIPVFMLALANVGEILANLFRATYSTICCCGCCRKKETKDALENMTEEDEQYVQKHAPVWRLDPETGRPIPPSEEDAIVDDEEDDEEEEEEETEEEEEELTVPLTITVIVFFLFILVGAISFDILEGENWDFVDSLYFSTITATTIGFGDLVPDIALDGGGGIFKALYVILYITFSMAAISMCFQLLADEIVAKFEWIGEKLGLKKKAEESEDNEDDDDEKAQELTDIEAGESDKKK